MNREQQLIDICFEIGLTINSSKYFDNLTQDQTAKWIANQLKECGFITEPCGSSYGVLVNK